MGFVDANVLLEVLLSRQRVGMCRAFLEDEEEKAISLLTLDLVMYYVEINHLATDPVKGFLPDFVWLPMMPEDSVWAFARFGGKDFEDALQVACAVREGCSRFVTLDRGLAKKYADDLKIDLLR